MDLLQLYDNHTTSTASTIYYILSSIYRVHVAVILEYYNSIEHTDILRCSMKYEEF